MKYIFCIYINGQGKNMYAMPKFFALPFFMCVFIFFYGKILYSICEGYKFIFLLNVCLNGYYYMGHICYIHIIFLCIRFTKF